MLDEEARKDVEQIIYISGHIWGDDCEYGKMRILDSPFPEFELPMRLYNKVDITLTYDRSILGIAVKTQSGNVWVDDLTSETIYDGFESCKPENLLHNFMVLDKVVCEMIESGKL